MEKDVGREVYRPRGTGCDTIVDPKPGELKETGFGK